MPQQLRLFELLVAAPDTTVMDALTSNGAMLVPRPLRYVSRRQPA
jgi:hypothetical protein